MASSKVMSSTSPVNQDLRRQSNGLQNDRSKSFGSMNMDELLKNIYGDADSFSALAAENGANCVGVPAAIDGDGSGASFPGPENVGGKTVDEVWKEIVTGKGERCEPELTLEDFLTKAGAVSEEEVRIPEMLNPPSGFSGESMRNATHFDAPPHMHSSHIVPVDFSVDSVGLGNGIMDGRMVSVGRGKRRAVEEPPLDRATQQKQRRMIKNRESAARSRERKQAYTIELEGLVAQLEEENIRLLREEAELNKERFKQLMINLIPVVEKPRPRRVLRRVQSM